VSALSQCEETTGLLADWIKNALSNRPDLEMLVYREEIAKEEIDKARAEHFPHLRLVGNYEINSEDFTDSNDNYAVGAVMQLNLYSGSRISAKEKSAKSNLRSSEALRNNLELMIRVQVRESFLTTQSAWQRIDVARRAVQQAKENLRIVKNRYNNGLLTIVDLLDAELTQQQSQTNHFKALYDYNVARIELARAAGIIDTNYK
jgi:outer membrane protein TolC